MSELPNLKDRRCLVTGGSRGLGLAICTTLAAAGARVALTYSTDDGDAEEARQAITEAGCEPLIFKGSVADPKHASATVRALVKQWGGLDVLINNAAITQVLPIALLEEEDWDEVMEVNTKGVYLFSRAALRAMIRAKAGHILNIGNFASERIIEAPAHYATSKSALRGFTEALAREVGRHNIQVNLLAPGLMEVGLGTLLPQHRVEEYLDQCPAGRIGTTREIAAMCAFLVSEENTFMTGAKIVMDGGL